MKKLKKLAYQLLHQEEGIVMLVAISFMALALPIITATLFLAGTASKDSAVKTSILKDNYAAQGCTQYAYYRVSKESGYVDSLSLGVPDEFDFNGCTITVTKVSEDEPLEVSYGDIVLALDNSGSVDDDEMELLEEASNTIVDHFQPGMEDGTIRVGISRFRGTSASVVDMTDVDIHGEGNFTYVDDPFRSTSQPSYADGEWDSSAGQSGGGLEVTLGGIDNSEILGMSGGWQSTFSLTSDEEVELSFAYNLTQDAEYEFDEYSEVIVTVDALQPGTGVNDYVARITGDGSGGSPQSTGWQTFQVNLGTLEAGIHTVTIGGYNNKKTALDKSTTVQIDDISVTVNCTTGCSDFVDSQFDTDSEGMSYIDDTFRSTSEPSYADGTWEATGGQSGGGLRVDLGGIDSAEVLGMSGGWQRDFTLASDQGVELSFSYKLTQAGDYESDEYSEVIVTMDAMQPGTGGNDYVAHISDGPQSTGWQTFQVDLGTLSSGSHTLTIGGYNNKKSTIDESTQAYIDNVVMTTTCTDYCNPLLDEDFEGDTPLHDGIDGLVQGAPDLGSGTNLVAGINGGALQFTTGLGDRIDPPSPNLMVVITDGDDTNGNSDEDIEAASAASGAEVFAIGVGTNISMDSLNAIASDEDADHVFTTADYSALLSLIDDIVAAVDGSLDIGILVSIQSVSPDGSVSEYEVLVPPSS